MEKDYDEFLAGIKVKFDDFMFSAQKGQTNKTAALAARKDAMFIRGLLKEFRTVSVENDRKPKA